MSLWRQALTVGVVTLAMLPATAAGEVAPGDEAWLEFTALPGLSTFPDWGTRIYQAPYTAGPAHETIVRGTAPRARFWSFAVLDNANREISNLSDVDIQTDRKGRYEVAIRLDCAGAPNCIETLGGTAPGVASRLFYRLYVPDDGPAGGVPLPAVEYRASPVGAGDPAPSLALPTTGVWTSLVDTVTGPFRPGGQAQEALASPSGREASVPEGQSGPDPQARRYDGLGGPQVETLENAGAPPEMVALVQALRGSGGFGATADNAYVTMEFTSKLGNLILSARAPTYRAQHKSAANKLGRRGGREQVRYWSICSTGGTRPVDCLRDEQVRLDSGRGRAKGYFTVVVAPDCPQPGFGNCLRAGKLTNDRPSSIIYRNLLARPEFANAEGPGTCPEGPSQFCGEYSLTGHYVARP